MKPVLLIVQLYTKRDTATTNTTNKSELILHRDDSDVSHKACLKY